MVRLRFNRALWERSGFYINRRLKRDVMNTGIPDAVTYLHPDHRKIAQGQFLREFERIRAMMGERDQVAMISSSLGSKILLDSARADWQKEGESSSLAARTTHFFMFANQIPLLELGISRKSLQSLADLRTRTLGVTKNQNVPAELVIVAFGDPSDLLTYHLDPKSYRQSGRLNLKIVNVEVRNRGFAFWPLYRGPLTAHSAYHKNRWVMERIVSGRRTEKPWRSAPQQ